MSDIRYNGWLHRSGTGGVWQDSSGQVGIGSSVPAGDINIRAQNPNIRLDDSDTANNGEITLDNTQLRIEVDEDDAIGSSQIKFRVDGSDKVTIDSSGYLGIGHDTPSGWSSGANNLVVKDAAGAGGITIVTPNNAMGSIFFADSQSASGQGRIRYDHNGDYMTLNTNATERLRLNSSGQVLVNSTTDPYDSRSLTVGLVPGQSNNYISIIGATNGVSGLTFGDALGEAAGNYAGMFEYYHSGDYLTYKQNGSEKLRIHSGGQLSTGAETAPDVSSGGLCLNQGAADTNIFSLKSSDIAHGVTTYDETDTYFSIRKSSGDKGGVRIHGFTDAAGADPALEFQGIINSDADQGYCPIEFRGSEANGTGVQNIAADRRIVNIKNSDGTRIASFTGTGLTFGNDFAVANALDDYEEGSWTPVPDNLSNSPQYANQVGIYTKWGNLVYVMGFLQFGSSPAPQFSSTANELKVSGLPFPCNAGAGYVGAVGHVTYQSMNWSGSSYNDYGASTKLVCSATTDSKTQFKVDGGNNTIRGTLRRAAWHDHSFIVTWSMIYRTTS